MEKTGQMIEFEEETGGCAIVTVKVGFAELQFPSEVYAEWIEAELLKASVKAAAYDRLMSGGPTAKEIANVLNRIIAMDHDGKWHAFCSAPCAKSNYQWIPVRGSSKYRVPCFHIKFDGDWEDSLTFPDGWEEA